MNKIFKLSLITAAIAITGCINVVSAPNGAPAATENVSAVPGSLVVQIDGFEKQEGQVSVALFDEAGYKGGAPVRGQNADVIAQSVTLNFENLPAGEYGIKLYQDVDGNGQMNTNAFGIPSEPFAFSNNAQGVMGPAKWDAAKCVLTTDGAVQKISLN